MPLLTDGQPPDDYSSSGGDASSWPGMMYDIRRSANDAPHYCSFLLLSFCTVVYRHGCMPVPATVTATIPFILKTLTGVVLVAHADVTLLWGREAWRFAVIKSAVAPRVFIQYENRWCTGFPFLCLICSYWKYKSVFYIHVLNFTNQYYIIYLVFTFHEKYNLFFDLYPNFVINQ